MRVPRCFVAMAVGACFVLILLQRWLSSEKTFHSRWLSLPRAVLREAARSGNLDVQKWSQRLSPPRTETGLRGEASCKALCRARKGCVAFVWRAPTIECILAGAAKHTKPPRRISSASPPNPPPPPLPPLAPAPSCATLGASTALNPHANTTRFVLVTSSARVGSNWVRSLLNQHPMVHMESELLSLNGALSLRADANATPFVAGQGAATSVDAAFSYTLRHSNFHTRRAEAQVSEATVSEAVRSEAIGSETMGGAIGWKAGGPRMDVVCGCRIDALLAHALTHHHSRLVYLYRKDAVAVALSKERARRSRLYVLHARAASQHNASYVGSALPHTPATQSPPVSDAITISDVKSFGDDAQWLHEHLTRFTASVERLAARPGARLLSLSYEELLDAPLAHLRRLFAFLGVDVCDVAMRQATARIGGTPLRRAVVNAREVCAELRARGLQGSASWRESCAS